METNELILLRLKHLCFFKRALAKKRKEKEIEAPTLFNEQN